MAAITEIDNPTTRWVDKSAILWIDVEDLFAYAHGHKRPSGIQRVAFELSRTLWADYGDTGRVRFVRHDSTRGGFRCVEWESIAELFSEMAGSITTAAAPPAIPPGIPPHPNRRQFVRELMYRLPTSLRVIVIEVLVTQEKAFRAWGHLIAALVRGVIRIPLRLARRHRRRKVVAEGSGPSHSVQTGRAANIARGDTVLALGAPWSHPNYTALIAAQRTRYVPTSHCWSTISFRYVIRNGAIKVRFVCFVPSSMARYRFATRSSRFHMRQPMM